MPQGILLESPTPETTNMNGYLAIEFIVPGSVKDSVASHNVIGYGWQQIVDGECVAIFDLNGKPFYATEYRLADGMNFKTPPFVKA